MTRFSAASALLFATLTAAACAETGVTDPTAVSSLPHSLAVSSDSSTSSAVIRGIVQGDRTVPSDTTRERVAGATIIVSREQRDSVGNGPATVTSVLIGSISTDARGEFELTRVPAGAYFRLDVTPPSTSPYRAGTSGTVSFAPDTRVLAVVNLTSH